MRYIKMLKCLLPGILSVCSMIMLNAQEKSPVDFVNPLIGTGKSSHHTVWESNGAVFPAVLAPFGMVQIAPDGYLYSDKMIRCFSFLNHCSGWTSLAGFHVMAYTGPVDSLPASKITSAFNHAREKTTPYCYQVILDDYKINAEFTTTTRVGFCRFTFPGSRAVHIFLSDINETIAVSGREIKGRSNGYYFIARFSRSFDSCRSDSSLPSSGAHPSAKQFTGVRIDYPAAPSGQQVSVKIAFSTRSYEGAEENIARELPDWDFEKTCRNLKKNWNDRLSQIEVKGGEAHQKEIFYTALYHSFFMPSLRSDAGEKTDSYTALYPWDTYRSEHPLITLLDPSREGDMIRSVLDRYEQTGWLPADNMLGNHNVELILDSYTKGVRNFDAGKALHAMRKSLMEPPFARRDMKPFALSGYVPANITNSVSQTLEFAYNDWALAEFIEATGNTLTAGYSEDRNKLLSRALYYRNLYDPSSGFMRAKTDSGIWTDGGFCEGTRWDYSWYAPHDLQGLINLMGGRKKFVSKLTACFENGHYVHDNEPPLHYAYLFDFAGEPWKTQKWVRKILEGSYSADPGGIPGNDDLGALSSWYVFSAMGFYPVTPGRPLYEMGSPLFKELIIHLSNGRNFTIKAPLASAKNKYIQSAWLDGHRYDKPWFTHEDVLKGGTIYLEMGPRPQLRWGSDTKNAPPSLTTGRPCFSITGLTVSARTVIPDEPILVSVMAENKGRASGVLPLNIMVDGRLFQTLSVRADPGSAQRVNATLKLYTAGQHSITVNELLPKQVLVKKTPPVFAYSDLRMPLPSLVHIADSFRVYAKVKNTGGSRAASIAKLYLNSVPIQYKSIVLSPGEQKEVRFSLALKQEGISSVGIDTLAPAMIRVLSKHDTGVQPDSLWLTRLGALLVLDFDAGPSSRIPDLSGNGNEALVKGNISWVNGVFGKAIKTDASRNSYLEVPGNSRLDQLAHSSALTIMTWIYPMEEENFADIFSKGEWISLQLKGGNKYINFYANGWEGHEVFAETPPDWNRHWHHLAGVVRDDVMELYIDGILAAKKTAEPRNPDGETGLSDYSYKEWNIGRNDNSPERVFKGYIDDLMVFSSALSPEDIMKLMLHAKE